MISAAKSPPPPFSKGGRPLWLAIPSSFPLLQRGMEGDFHARGRQDFSVMNVYEAVTASSFQKHENPRQADPGKGPEVPARFPLFRIGPDS